MVPATTVPDFSEATGFLGGAEGKWGREWEKNHATSY